MSVSCVMLYEKNVFVKKETSTGHLLILHLFFCWDEMNQIPFLWYLALVSGCSYSISRNKYSNQLRPVPAVNKENSELFSSFLVLIYCLFLLLAIHIVHLCNSFLCVVFTLSQDDAVGNLHEVQIILHLRERLF